MIYTPEDKKIFASLLQAARRRSRTVESAGELVLEVGRVFLGTPYAARTLEREEGEALVINLRQMDCFTLVENALAIARLIRSGKSAFGDYAAVLAAIRYREGRLEGYSSRLHYFCDWLFDNRKKGLVRNVTRSLGGQPYVKKIDFMTRHADRYPALRNHDACRQMAAVERKMWRRVCCYIPKGSLRHMEDRIADGDLIAVTAAAAGLDVMHVGLAARVKGKLHLLHASSAARKVVVSRETLDRWLAGNEGGTGLMVARAIDPLKP